MAQPAKPRHGAVRQQVERLLTAQRKKPLSYREVADRVRAKVPGAHTTDRTVASIATALRHSGADLPDRRRHI